MCQGYLADDEHITFAVDWMITWMLDVFYGIKNEETDISDDDEPDGNDEHQGPHDDQRCEAGRKGTCRRCIEMRQHH